MVEYCLSNNALLTLSLLLSWAKMEFKPQVDELFLLVKSLSQAEKRYFRRYTKLYSNQGNPKYLLLFDALLQMPAYNEASLRNRCNGEKFLSQLPAAKRHLMELLLRCLRMFREGKSIDQRIRKVLDELEVLYERGLYKNCIRRIRKAKVLAQEYDRLNLMLELFRWERRLLKKVNGEGLANGLKQLESEESNCQLRLENELQLIRVHDSHFGTLPEDRVLLPQASPNDTFDAQLARYNLLASQAYRDGREKESQSHFKTCLEVWEAHPQQLNAHPTRYFGALQNYLASCHRACEYDDYEDQLSRIRAFPGLNSESASLIDPMVGNLELVYRLNRGQHHEALQVATDLEQRLKVRKSRGLALNLNMIEYNLAVTYFVLDHPSECLRNLDKIIRRGRPIHKQKEYNLARLWELIVHLELGNTDLLPYLQRSVKRHFQKHPSLPVLHRVVLPKLSKVHRKGSLDAPSEAYEMMYGELIALPDEAGKTELLHWVKSHMEGVPIRSLLNKESG